MLEALWSVQFITSQQTYGGGVVIFETQRIFGGDTSFFYVGTYTVDQGQIKGTVRVRRHSQGLPSAFDPLEDFELSLTGKIQPNQFRLDGELVGLPREKIQVLLTHQAALP